LLEKNEVEWKVEKKNPKARGVCFHAIILITSSHPNTTGKNKKLMT